ncbi:2-dehydro-3-deoxygalactonokinase [Ramlibacter sp. PS4R-6]|uniref:2-dehydro-3-deoxygalactonokinase n=1 Tax=Ramlibacter sp. PS4R-6 TaxID=3133438 RepID=UPI0030B5B1B8
MKPLVGVDWGTSSLRVARVDASGHAIEQREFPRGILTVPAGGFPQVFGEACGDWMKEPGAVALICGMAGSRQGWQEAPYAPCPAGHAEIASQLAWIDRGRIAIVPGLSFDAGGAPDVMRGEETAVLGVMKLLGVSDARIVMPGTHCKWVRVRAGRIESFATYMTGEFYAMLRQHSILARTLPAQDGELYEDAFLRGVDYAMHAGNLLHAAFTARTLSLFERLPQSAAPSYLSGLLIGEELRSQDLHAGDTLVLAGADKLTQRYGLALSHLRAPFRVLGQEATWLGLHAIAQSVKELA